MESAKTSKKYYLGLDIGTDSVGYAATDEAYKPLKFNGEPMMGTHLIDPVGENITRRAFRTARRRLDRKQQRVQFIREIFAEEISKVDINFFKRLDCSALFEEDKCVPSKNSFFNDKDYCDRDFHKEYPTIHHLICALMNGTARKDARLLYIAVAYLVAHRGHFLSEVDKDDVQGVLDFDRIYSEFIEYFEPPIWDCAPKSFSDILRKKCGVSVKEKELISLLFGGKKPKVTSDDVYDKAVIVKLLAGGKAKADALFINESYSEIQSFSLSVDDETFDAIVAELGDDGDLLVLMKKLYDWSVLTELVPDGSMISEEKVKVYEQHKKDLKFLKRFIKKYRPEKYYEIFRASNVTGNYVKYSYNVKNADNRLSVEGKSNKYEFCEYILKIVKDIAVEDADRAEFEDMLFRLNKDVASFMPKQVDGNNRLIPYQLYYVELVKILNTAKIKFEFLNVKDNNGITPCEKIISTFLHRVPYYVGPLNTTSEKSWVVRGKEKITPWNFDKVVDLDRSEEAFIRKMTNKCTYLPGEDVLPKNSLWYSKFEVLNEINNLKINGEKIDVKTKQEIFTEVFMVHAKVTPKRIQEHLISKSKITKDDTLSGIDTAIKSSLKSYIFFKKFINDGILSESDVEKILSCKAYSEDAFRFKKWLSTHYPQLSEADVKLIANQKFKEFGRLSHKFLCNFEGEDKNTGEVFTIIEALWNTNYNLMQLLSDEFTFREKAEAFAHDYYSEHTESLSDRINDMYIPNAVKRPVIRTIDIVKDVVKAQKCAPEKIFVEMARGGKPEEKGKRTSQRREQILEFYKAYGETDEINMLKEQLSEVDDRRLRSEVLYLYFIQLGRCMYCGEPIDINDLGKNVYNVDHIYPRCFVKDDSITNKVLVHSRENGDKGDTYPIASAIRSKMTTFWRSLKDSGLISDEKYKRLTRATQFSEEERWGFINRQLVETRQSTKAVATLLKEMFPDTEIVYVKAGLVSEFRQAFDLLKSRSVNDLHHAKDAYLNVVVGNVYNSVFTKKWFNPSNDKYSLKAEKFFDRAHKPGGCEVWNGSESIAFVKKIMSKNNIHLTKYAFCRHGGFFDQMPLKAGANDMLIPRKKGLDTEKYGGYNRTTASFFVLVKYTAKKKNDLIVMPVELMYADKFVSDREFALEYSRKTIAGIVNAEPQNIEFPLGMRKIKVNTVLELDGFRIFISGKSGGGRQLTISSLTSAKMGNTWETYVKRIEKFVEERKDNPKRKISPSFDKITYEENMALYDAYCQKSTSPLFVKTLCSSVSGILISGRDKFASMCIEEQANAIMSIVSVFKTGRKGGCDLTSIGGSSAAGALVISSRVSNWKKTYSSVHIIDTSASGLYESKSVNLLDLI